MKVGTKVRFQFIERGPWQDGGDHYEIAREASGKLICIDSCGMAEVELEHTNLRFKTLPWAVKRIVKKKRKK